MASSESLVGLEVIYKFKIDIASALWRPTTRISQVLGGGAYIWKCNFRNTKSRNNSYSRMKPNFIDLAGKCLRCQGLDKKGLSPT